MIRENLQYFINNWITEKAIASEILTENKKFNEELKQGKIPGKLYPNDRKSFSLYGLKSAKRLTVETPVLLYSKCGIPISKYKIQGSIGQGNPAEIPWICIFDREITISAQEGYYIVYLFNSKMNGIYLSLNQGWTQYEKEFGIREGKIQVKNNANYAKSLLRSDQGFSYDPIKLNSTKALGKGYEEGNICSKFYSANSIPLEDELIDDLRNLIGVYRELKGIVGYEIMDIKGRLNEDLFQEEIQKGKRVNLANGKIEKKTKKTNSTSTSWPRNNNISFTALDNANFNCENNTGHNTFISAKSGNQFVEAHHFIPMEFQDDFDVSIDVPENIISLCPNCHRAFHNSIEETKTALITKFYLKRKELLERRGITTSVREIMNYYKVLEKKI